MTWFAGALGQTGGGSAAARPSSRHRRPDLGLLLLAPAVVLLAAGLLYPLAFTVGTSFERGWSDYAWALDDPINRSVMVRTFAIAGVAAGLCCLVA